MIYKILVLFVNIFLRIKKCFCTFGAYIFRIVFISNTYLKCLTINSIYLREKCLKIIYILKLLNNLFDF